MENKQLVVDLTEQLVDINSENPPGSEKQVGRFIFDYLQDLKIDAELIEFEKERFNVVAELGKGDGIMLNGHMDTVPIVNSMTKNGKIAEVRGGNIYGRGTADTKGGIASILAALEETEIKKIKKKLLFTFVADEEVDFKGSKWLLERRQELFEGIKYGVIAEPTGLKLCVAQKGCIGASIKFKGKAAHASTPWLGDNAIIKASNFIQKLEGNFAKFGVRDELMGKSTLVVSKISGGIAGNVVPDTCEVDVDMRVIPQDTTARSIEYIKDIMKLCDDTAEFNLKMASEAFRIDKDSEIVSSLREIVGSGITFSDYYTEAELYFNRIGLECVAFGPGSGEVAHRPDEYVSVANLEKSTFVYKELIKRWCM